MSKLTIYDTKGASVGEHELKDALLVTTRGAQAVHDVVVAHGAARRAGTADTKRKGEVAGSNKKPWKQKGTGRARAGYRQSPVWRGGGVAFGPHPRSYAVKINKKVGQLAFRRAFGDRVQDGAVKLVDELAVPERKTRRFVEVMKALGVSAPALFVVDKIVADVRTAARNLPDVALVPASDVNVYDLVRYPTVVVTRAGLAILEKRLAAGVKGAA